MTKRKKHRLNRDNMDKTLDDLLSYLKSTLFFEDQDYIQYLNSLDIFFFCYGDKLNDVHNYTEPKLFLDKLKDDGFVDFKSSENGYQINLNGVEFINNGGYQKRTSINTLKNYWDGIKILAIALNAILLLIFTYYASKLV